MLLSSSLQQNRLWTRFVGSLVAVAAAVLAGPPCFSAPADAIFDEAFDCQGNFMGTDLALPEALPLNHVYSVASYSFAFNGLARTWGTGGDLPRAQLDLSPRALIGGDPGSLFARCTGGTQVIYEVEIRHDAGTAARSVPLLIASRGGVSTSASSWGSKIAATALLRITPVSGGTATAEIANGCSGTAFSGCGSLPAGDSFSVVLLKNVMVPAGASAAARVEIALSTNANSNVFVQMWPPDSGEVDRAGFASASAWVDPQVWIDPTWTHAEEYSLAFSVGVPAAPDGDLDSVPDDYDNCTDVENPDQADFDAPDDDDTSLGGVQHYGDACDADFDDDGLVGPSDFFSTFRPCLGVDLGLVPACAEADLDGDGVVGSSDFFGLFRPAIGTAPGPGISESP